MTYARMALPTLRKGCLNQEVHEALEKEGKKNQIHFTLELVCDKMDSQSFCCDIGLL